MREELLERLLGAAQDVVNSEDIGHFSHGADVAAVGRDEVDRLRTVVQTISDEACAELERLARGRSLTAYNRDGRLVKVTVPEGE